MVALLVERKSAVARVARDVERGRQALVAITGGPGLGEGTGPLFRSTLAAVIRMGPQSNKTG